MDKYKILLILLAVIFIIGQYTRLLQLRRAARPFTRELILIAFWAAALILGLILPSYLGQFPFLIIVLLLYVILNFALKLRQLPEHQTVKGLRSKLREQKQNPPAETGQA
ncbi:MAG: hypothetical protein PHR21_03610, partial [Oscillospiraceae bacterium]|nr:hypothetical protein [Oscillospiraceae bacterium]